MSLFVAVLMWPASPAGASPTYADVLYRTINGVTITLNVFEPTAEPPSTGFPAVVVVHGAWRKASKSEYADEGQTLADNGFVAFLPNYRMPCDPATYQDPDLCGYVANAGVTDVLAAVAWVRANAATYNVDPTHVGALGGSGGATIALMTAGTMGKAHSTRPDAIVAWSGFTKLWDTSGSSDPTGLAGNFAEYVGCAIASGGKKCVDRYYKASPLGAADGAAQTKPYIGPGMKPPPPPIYLANGTAEVTPLQNARDMAAALDGLGVKWTLRCIEGDYHSRQYENFVVTTNMGTETVFQESMRWLHYYLDRSGTSPALGEQGCPA